MPDVAPFHCRSCCLIASDDFNRADSDSLGADWDEVAGDADIDGNQLLIPVGNETVLQFLTVHPQTGGNQRVRVKFKLPSAGAADGDPYAGAIVGWQNSDNYLWAAVYGVTESGARQALDLRLFQRQAGTETEIQDPQRIIVEAADDGQFHTLEVCYEFSGNYPYSDSILRAKVTLASGSIWGSQAVGDFDAFAGNYVGLRARSGDTQGVIRYEDFSFSWMQDEDGDCKRKCPDCNTPCPIVSDDFAYDWGTDTDLGPLWNGLSGSWQRVSNEAKQTAASAGILLCRTFHPQIKTHHYVTCDVYVDADLKPRVLVNSTSDASSYHWAELEWNGTDTLTLRIGKDGNTLETTTTAFGAAAFVSVTVCYDGGALTASITNATAFAESTAVPDGIYVGLAGNSAGGGERFDNFSFQKHFSVDDPEDRNCPNCVEEVECSHCEDGVAPPRMLLTIAGVTGAACVNENASFILTKTDNVLIPCGDVGGNPCNPGEPINCCIWCEEIICNTGVWQVCILSGKVRVWKNQLGGSGFVNFEKDYSPSSPNCMEFNDENIPLELDANGAGCDFTNATARLTTL